MHADAELNHLELLFASWFGAAPRERMVFAKAPGRLELAGNHTDHQGGLVISAALGRYVFALAAPTAEGDTVGAGAAGAGRIRVRMEGFEPCDIDLSAEDAFEPHDGERGTSAALVRGMCAGYAAGGGTVRGFDMVTTSNLPAGAGVSSSAAFEMLVGVVLRALDVCHGEVCRQEVCQGDGSLDTEDRQVCHGDGSPDTEERVFLKSNVDDILCQENRPHDTPDTSDTARVPLCQENRPRDTRVSDEERLAMALQGQDAEQRFFGKSCGAQDQIASAFGGAVFMDFSPAAPAPPQVTRIPFDAAALPWQLVLVDSRVDHSRFTADFDSVTADMFAMARALGATRLVDVGEDAFRENGRSTAESLPNGERTLSRSTHFFAETARVAQQYAALRDADFATFARLAQESGISNRLTLQNVTPMSAPPDDAEAHRPARIMDECAHLLGDATTPGQAAWRMHGGGFGGSILVLVPPHRVDGFIAQMNAALGYEACTRVAISPEGAVAETVPCNLPGRVAWEAPSRFGNMEITVNLRKPEKDPRAIAAALSQQAAGVERPCDLCREVRTWDAAREVAHDARVAGAGVEFALDGERWMLHFSPYGYYPLHCIAMTEVHRPMAITPACIRRLFAIVDRFPYYFMGSNADLPIVGGSILGHDHFQGGGHVFPLMRAGLRAKVRLADFPQLTCGIVDWPASTLRIEGDDAADVAAAAIAVTEAWRTFDFAPCSVKSHTGDVPHNTVTPIVYKRSFVDGKNYDRGTEVLSQNAPYVINLVLRNNRTTPGHPYGLFHAPERLHHIKKENIGLIEIMGLAVLPGRLVREIPGLATDEAAQAQVTDAFVRILAATGVFKDTETGLAGWKAFLGGINGEIVE